MEKKWKAFAVAGGVLMALVGLLLVAMASGLLTVERLTAWEILGSPSLTARLVMGAIGLVMLGLPLVALRGLQGRLKAQTAALPCGPKDQGVALTLACVRDGIVGVASQIPEISWLAPEIEWRRGIPSILIRTGLRPTASVRDSATRLQGLVRRYADDVLGLTELHEVRIMIEKIDVWDGPPPE